MRLKLKKFLDNAVRSTPERVVDLMERFIDPVVHGKTRPTVVSQKIVQWVRKKLNCNALSRIVTQVVNS